MPGRSRRVEDPLRWFERVVRPEFEPGPARRIASQRVLHPKDPEAMSGDAESLGEREVVEAAPFGHHDQDVDRSLVDDVTDLAFPIDRDDRILDRRQPREGRRDHERIDPGGQDPRHQRPLPDAELAQYSGDPERLVSVRAARESTTLVVDQQDALRGRGGPSVHQVVEGRDLVHGTSAARYGNDKLSGLDLLGYYRTDGTQTDVRGRGRAVTRRPVIRS